MRPLSTLSALLCLCLCLASPANSTPTPSGTLQFDHKRRLARNALLFQNTTHCRQKITRMWTQNNGYSDIRDLIALNDSELSIYYAAAQAQREGHQTSRDQSCLAVCVNEGTAEEYLYHPLPYLIYMEQLSSSSPEVNTTDRHHLLDWNYQCRIAEVSVISFRPEDLSLVWIDVLNADHNKTLYKIKEQSQWQTAYLGHNLVVINTATKVVMYNYTITYSTEIVLGHEYIARQKSQLPSTEEQVAAGNSTVLRSWQGMEEVKRTFSQLGFAKGRVPVDVWASMCAYYSNNFHNYHLEPSAPVVISKQVTQTQFLNMPPTLKRYWQSRLRELVEQWIGGEVPLENTFIYGIRRYGEGARLMLHVDRLHTHAVSMIVNIDQDGMRRPWSLEVFDFAGRLHEVNMQPGDLVYYESARIFHSRARALQGNFFANMFLHYRPIVAPGSTTRWYQQPNPPATPAPLMDLGECSPNTIKENMGGETGGGYTCGGVFLPYLVSPQPVITSVEDVMKFWEQYDDESEGGDEVVSAGGVGKESVLSHQNKHGEL